MGQQLKTPVLVVMAAGIGSRYGGLKQLEPVTGSGDKIIDFSIYDALRAGFRKVIFIIRSELEQPFRQAIGDKISQHIAVAYAYQQLSDLPEGCEMPAGRSKPYGTGHAILTVRDMVDENFAVINADDYYGPESFRLIYDALAGKTESRPYEFSMVGYELGKTISEHGSVSRGVCLLDAAGYLAGVAERTKIRKDGHDVVFSEDDGKTWQTIPASTIVSMNLWGFTPGILQELAQSFRLFCRSQLPAHPLKAEFYLNAVIDELIRQGKARVRVLPTTDRWQGITYPADKDEVVAALAKLRQAGIYPENLWR